VLLNVHLEHTHQKLFIAHLCVCKKLSFVLLCTWPGPLCKELFVLQRWANYCYGKDDDSCVVCGKE